MQYSNLLYPAGFQCYENPKVSRREIWRKDVTAEVENVTVKVSSRCFGKIKIWKCYTLVTYDCLSGYLVLLYICFIIAAVISVL